MTKIEHEMMDVVCALIIKAGKLLIVQYGLDSKHPGKWEFPGGKVQPGESPESALIREIREELEMQIQPIFRLEPAEYTYPDKSILLLPFICSRISNDLNLNEHVMFEWVSLEELPGFDLLPADRAVLDIEMNNEALIGFMSKTHC